MKKTAIIFLCVLLVSVNIFTEERKSSSNQEKYFAMAKVPPLSDFEYELTEDMEGVKITKYKGEALHVLIPNEIEGLPVVELGDYSFSSRKKMETIIIPDTVKKIGRYVFYFCDKLKNIRLSKAITSIVEGMFSSCESLEEFIIPDHIINIESSAFSHTGIISIYLPDRITFRSKSYSEEYEISTFVFNSCKNLKKVRLPSSITVIGDKMFSRCTSLQNIILPEGLTKIGESAFADCPFTELTIPNTVTTILSDAFYGYKGKKLIIPDSVTELDCSFSSCKNLEYLHLSNSLTEINSKLFHDKNSPLDNSRALVSVNLPESLKRISSGSFYELKSLKELIIPDTLLEIEFFGNDIFLGTQLPLLTQKKLKKMGYTGKF
ncbi:leucine-rich repeat domain-containing protein [Treponema denticola]|uniref:leucine-rich repeat domain-containing protein n=1 Tax=Treponema denticola TaxID=158 RepID=UPI0020A57DB8|nr:leucine-rich repeat domain-containing protein [Treponema denticola]UTD08159.1 leucine-rich repeat domain-containing protein [Treponema denticola]